MHTSSCSDVLKNKRGRLSPPVVLSIAGSDNSSGAGIQADLKTFSELGCYGLTAVTCIVAEIPGRVSAIQPVKAAIVAEQVRLSLDTFPVAAAKTGMLFSTPVIETIAGLLAGRVKENRKRLPLVVDPVMVATSGAPLLKRRAIAACKSLLFPLATVITPNIDELETLTGRKVETLDRMRSAAAELHEKHGCAVLAKGGHLSGDVATDILIAAEGEQVFEAPFRRGISTHGTGCTLSAAIAAGLANGGTLSATCAAAKCYVTSAIREAFQWERATALNHFASRNAPRVTQQAPGKRGPDFGRA